MIASEVVGQFPRWRALPLSEIRQRLSKFVTVRGPTRFVSLIRACGSATNSIIHGGSPASSAYFPQSERGPLTLCLRMILRQADHELTTRYLATLPPRPRLVGVSTVSAHELRSRCGVADELTAVARRRPADLV